MKLPGHIKSKKPWNKGKLTGQKPPLKLKEIWAIRMRLQISKQSRDLALLPSVRMAKCARYLIGEFDWAKPEHQYCSFVYTDQSGLHYSKSTKNTWKPERVGKWRKIEYIEGDKYGLAGN